MSKELEKARELVRMLEEKERENKVVLSSLNPGETFKIGEHDFIVLNQGKDCTEVISKGFMAESEVFDNNTRDYAKSSLKKLIEKEIQPLIEKNIGADNIIEHSVDLTSVDNQHEFDSCKCKVRPITFDEARKYNGLLVNENLKDWWWTCTPWSIKGRGLSYSNAVVAPAGGISDGNCDNYGGVRPFCILKSNIFVSKGE